MRWVLKLGGSLYAHAALVRLLEQARRLSDQSARCTIVPGGGPFADQVREAYRRHSLSEQTAHQMAMLGMRQYGRLLAELSRLPLCCSKTRSNEQCAIWLPTDEPLDACLAAIPLQQLDWDFTSDSVSMCLAHHIEARYLILVKAISVDRVTPLVKLVDRRFIPLMQNSSVEIICISADQLLQLNSLKECLGYRVSV